MASLSNTIHGTFDGLPYKLLPSHLKEVLNRDNSKVVKFSQKETLLQRFE